MVELQLQQQMRFPMRTTQITADLLETQEMAVPLWASMWISVDWLRLTWRLQAAAPLWVSVLTSVDCSRLTWNL